MTAIRPILHRTSIYLVGVLFGWILASCSEMTGMPEPVEGCTDPNAVNYDPLAEVDDGSCEYQTGPTPFELVVPRQFDQFLPDPFIPPGNPLTVEGVALGRKLFFDPILSGDGTQACANCHMPQSGFTENNAFSVGIDGIFGMRNSMAIFNAAWNFNNRYFWDGRSVGLRNQALEPVTNPIEMHNTWPNAMAALQSHPDYPSLFEAAFGTDRIDSILVARAIEQFELTLISGDSKFDRYLREEINLTPQEFRGLEVFMAEEGGDCFHCHGNPANPLWTDNDFHNNGLDSFFTDLGLGAVTGNAFDNGKFKTPSLRNLAYTAPYMHDGRFETLDEVLEHYSTEVKMSPTIDPLMQFAFQGGVQMTQEEKDDLKAFLMTLNDETFITNPDFQAP